MTISELINELRKLPPNAEVALLSTTAFARPPEIHRVNQFAGWKGNWFGPGCGLNNPTNAYLIRPAKEIVR